jgi:hypothetical protein
MKTWMVALLGVGMLAACDNMSTNRTTGSGATVGGATGGGSGQLSRPNPTGSASGAVVQPSNSPMNDPVGGAGQATQPGFNQNR